MNSGPTFDLTRIINLLKASASDEKSVEWTRLSAWLEKDKDSKNQIETLSQACKVAFNALPKTVQDEFFKALDLSSGDDASRLVNLELNNDFSAPMFNLYRENFASLCELSNKFNLSTSTPNSRKFRRNALVDNPMPQEVVSSAPLPKPTNLQHPERVRRATARTFFPSGTDYGKFTKSLEKATTEIAKITLTPFILEPVEDEDRYELASAIERTPSRPGSSPNQ